MQRLQSFSLMLVATIAVNGAWLLRAFPQDRDQTGGDAAPGPGKDVVRQEPGSLPPPAQEPLGGPPYRTCWAVCVGINRYQQAGLPPLTFATADAQALRDLLVQHYGFPPDHVTVLLQNSSTMRGGQR